MVANLAITTLVGFEQRMASSLITSMKHCEEEPDASMRMPGAHDHQLHGVTRRRGWMHESIRDALRAEKNIS